jgi:flagellar motility protein MotE (MotC chaperone)
MKSAALGLLTLVLCASGAQAETPAPEGEQAEVRQAIADYCEAVSDAAADRRMATQMASLKDLEARVEESITRLEQEKAALEALIKRREELRDLARKELVEIYAGMDPEQASRQMEQLDVKLASSVLRQLKPRVASAILSEMSPERAAKLAKMIASAAQTPKDEQ